VEHTGGLIAQIGWLGLRLGIHLALRLNSLSEPDELLRLLCHDSMRLSAQPTECRYCQYHATKGGCHDQPLFGLYRYITSVVW